jgi:hypothetical protein
VLLLVLLSSEFTVFTSQYLSHQFLKSRFMDKRGQKGVTLRDFLRGNW